MDDSKFYDAVALEIQNKTLVPGLWARAYAEAEGNDAKAQALYIRYRVAQMIATNSTEAPSTILNNPTLPMPGAVVKATVVSPPPLNNPAPTAPAGPPKRHGCLTTWLIIMLILDALLVLVNVAGGLISSVINSNPDLSAKVSQSGAAIPSEPVWVTACACLAYILDIFFVIFIFRWKRWAFFGSVLMSLALIALIIAGGGSILSAAGSLISPIILFGVLQIGGANSGWRRLK